MSRKNETESERPVPLLFDAEQVGRSLREVGVDVIDSDGVTVLSRWFHSTRDVDLLIWTDEKKNIIKHQLSFFGQVVEWNIFDGLKTGVIVEEEAGNDADGETNELIQFDSEPQVRAVHQALSLLEYVAELSTSDRESMRSNVLTRAKGAPEQSDELVRRYKQMREGIHVGRHSFWKRVRRWFSGTGTE